MASNAGIARFDTLRSVAFGSIAASYTAVGSAFTHSVRTLKIVNLTDQPVLVSFDGTNDNDVLPMNSGEVYDFGANSVANVGNFEQPNNTTVYVKRQGSAPSSGSVYVVIIYGATS